MISKNMSEDNDDNFIVSRNSILSSVTPNSYSREEETYYNSVEEIGGMNLSFNSHLDDIADLYPDLSESLTRFAAICCILFIFLGIPGNILTIIALARCKKVHNATAYFIINLSLCDLMFCSFNLPLAVSLFWNRKWVHGKMLCTLFPFFRYGLMAVSIFTVLAITINRYIMIGHPRFYPRMYSTGYICGMIVVIWLGSFSAIIPTLFGLWGQFDLDRNIASCSIIKDARNRSPKIFLFGVAFVLPCCAIIICYARIFCIVRQARVNSRSADPCTTSSTPHLNNVVTHSMPNSNEQDVDGLRGGRPSIAVIHQRGRMNEKDKKLLWMILVIFGTFVLCHLPITIVKSITSEKNSSWNIFGYILIYSTTCMNPIIYVLMSSEYRQAYRGLILCKKDYWTTNSRSQYQSAVYQQRRESSSRKYVQTDSSST